VSGLGCLFWPFLGKWVPTGGCTGFISSTGGGGGKVAALEVSGDDFTLQAQHMYRFQNGMHTHPCCPKVINFLVVLFSGPMGVSWHSQQMPLLPE